MSNFKWIFVWMVSCSISGVFGVTTFVQTSHNFTSENFPSNYPSNHAATWNFDTELNQRLLLRFGHISTERIFDQISVGDGSFPSNYSQLLRWSGEDKDHELAVLSTGNKLWVTFQADLSLNSRGFTARVERVSAERIQDIFNCSFRCGDRVCLTKNDVCDGLINCEDGADENCTDTVFVDSNRDLGSLVRYDSYPNNFRFTWYFETTPGFQLLLEFDFINSEKHEDFVTVGEGHNVSLNKLLTWSYDSKGNMVQVVSVSNLMWMELSTDESDPSLSFTGSISKRNVTQEGWKCSSDSFSCSEYVCIPNVNQCDFYIQCPDGEDERLCSHFVDDEVCNNNLVCFVNECLSRNGNCYDNSDQCREPKYGCSGLVPDGKPYKKHWGNFSYTYNISANIPGHHIVLSLQLFTREYEAISLIITEGEETSELLSLKGNQVPSHIITVYSLKDIMTLSFTAEGGLYLKVDELLTAEEFDCGNLNTFQCSYGVCIPRELVNDGREDCFNGMDEATPRTTTDAAGEENYNQSIVDEELDRIAETNLTNDNVVEVAQELERVSGHVDIISAENVESIIDSIENIVQFNVTADQVINITGSVVAIANNIMEVSSETLNHVTDVARVPLLLEEQAATLLLKGQNYSEIQENVGVSAIRIRESAIKSDVTFGTFNTRQNFTDGNFRLSESNTGFRERFGNKEPWAAISLPRSLLESIEKANLTKNGIPLSFFVFKDPTLFPMQTDNDTRRDVIISQVISAAVAMDGININNLLPNESVLARFYSFPVSTGNDDKEERSCVYWKYNLTLGRGEWDTNGCKMVQSDDSYDTCLCNHLTSFAVLVRVSTEPYQSNPILDAISLVGRVLSIVGLSICVVTSLAMKEARRKQLTQIHINLSIALIALYVTFSIGIKATRDYIRCKITASFIHFFCLSSMAWMSLEALNMFVFLWTMRRNNIKHLLLIGSPLAWGFPFAVSLSVYLFDEPTEYQGVNDYCFLHPGVSLYIGFLLPIFVLFVFNSVVFVLITYRVSCRKIIATNEEARRKAEVARIKGPILFWILLGLSWIFGFLIIFRTPLTILFEILFSVFLSLQGVFMFYMLTLNNPEIKVKLKRYRDLVTEAFERSITSQLPLRSFTSNQHVDVTVESQTVTHTLH